jgi:hypothetical protein
VLPFLRDISRALDGDLGPFSYWAVRWLSRLHEQVVEEMSKPRREWEPSKLFEWFRDYESFPRYNEAGSLSPDYVTAYTSNLQNLYNLRESWQNRLVAQSIPVEVNGVTRIVEAFWRSGTVYFAPTDALVRVSEVTQNGQTRRTVGTHFEERDGHRVTFSAELVVDPLLAAAALQQLKEQAHGHAPDYGGLFDDWALSAAIPPDSYRGIGQAEVAVRGRVLDCTIPLGDTPELALRALGDGLGVPLILDWKYGDPPIRGKITSISLSFTRQSGYRLAVSRRSDGARVIENPHPMDVVVYYLRRRSHERGGEYHSLEDPLLVRAGSTSVVAVPGDEEVDVPSEAVVSRVAISHDLFRWSRAQVREPIMITNLISRNDRPLDNELLTELEVDLECRVNGQLVDQKFGIRLGPKPLTNTGQHPGNVAAFEFVRIQDGDFQISIIGGKAHYNGGSYLNIRRRDYLTNERFLYISREMLEE